MAMHYIQTMIRDGARTSSCTWICAISCFYSFLHCCSQYSVRFCSLYCTLALSRAFLLSLPPSLCLSCKRSFSTAGSLARAFSRARLLCRCFSVCLSCSLMHTCALSLALSGSPCVACSPTLELFLLHVLAFSLCSLHYSSLLHAFLLSFSLSLPPSPSLPPDSLSLSLSLSLIAAAH